MAPTGEPRESPKPQPLGDITLVSLFTLSTLCLLFVLWRRASSLRTVVGHQLKTWTQTEGAIRLSEDDGPPAHTFVEDDDDDEDPDDEPLSRRAERLRHETRPSTARNSRPKPPSNSERGGGEL